MESKYWPEMTSPLLELIFLSEKRTGLLLLLKESPKSIEEIMADLDINLVALLPQIKRLREKKLLIREGNICRLSPLGEAITGKMEVMVDTLRLFASNYDYWKDHLLEGIPPHLLKNIHELTPCTFSEPKALTHFFEPHREFVENIEKSSSVKGVTPIFHPLYPEMFLRFAEKGTDVSLVLTEAIFERVRKEFSFQIEKFISLKNTHLYVYKNDMKLATVVTDCFFTLSLFSLNGTFDHQKDVLSFEPRALKWGEELFEYYRLNSEEIKEF